MKNQKAAVHMKTCHDQLYHIKRRLCDSPNNPYTTALAVFLVYYGAILCYLAGKQVSFVCTLMISSEVLLLLLLCILVASRNSMVGNSSPMLGTVTYI